MLIKLIRKMPIAAICLAILCCTGRMMLAQSTTQGAIGGTVFDPTNAVVGNAIEVIRNDATNAETTVKSDASGSFNAPLIEPGTYTVTISAPGRDMRPSR